MKSAQSIALCIICIFLISCTEEQTVGASDIQALINEKIQLSYYQTPLKLYKDKSQVDKTINFLNQLQAQGLFAYSHEKTKRPYRDIFYLTVNNNTEVIPVIPQKGEEKQFAFPVAARAVDEIIRVHEKDLGDRYEITTYFTYTVYYYPETVSTFNLTNSQEMYKGKAILHRDIFTQTLSLVGLSYSEMDELTWKQSEWAELREGVRVVVR